MEEIGGLGCVGARVGEVAAAEFGGGEIDEDQHAFLSNRLDLVQWTAPDVAEAVDRRVVASLNRSACCSTPCETSLAEASTWWPSSGACATRACDQPRSVALGLPTARYQLPAGDGFCLPDQKEQVHPPLARQPYDLRQAAASLWLNNGVHPTEVARRLGHDVAVLLKIYVNCIDGQEDTINDQITAALTAGQDHETLPAAPAVDSAAQPNPRTRRGPEPRR